MLFYGKYGLIGRCKDIALSYNKKVINLITYLSLTSLKNIMSEFCNGFAEFCQQYCTTLTMVLQNFDNSLLVVKERRNMKWISSRQDEIQIVLDNVE